MPTCYHKNKQKETQAVSGLGVWTPDQSSSRRTSPFAPSVLTEEYVYFRSVFIKNIVLLGWYQDVKK